MSEPIDISSGIHLSDAERSGLHAALASLTQATTDAERRVALIQALKVLQVGAPLLMPVLGPAGVAIMETLVAFALKETGG